jgi:hypothetical protein
MRKLSKIAYHIVPKYVYEKSINRLGNYNCSGFENSKFMHATSELKELKKVADLLFTRTAGKDEILNKRNEFSGMFYEKPDVEFLLLRIEIKKVKSRIGFIPPAFCHFYNSIPKNAFKVVKVKRDKSGRFLL